MEDDFLVFFQSAPSEAEIILQIYLWFGGLEVLKLFTDIVYYLLSV